MLVEQDIVFGSQDNPLVMLEKYELDIDPIYLIHAQSELLAHLDQQEDTGGSWCFFPHQEGAEDYPSCTLLQSLLSSFVDSNLSLYFIRAARSRPADPVGGLHLDVETGPRNGVFGMRDEEEIMRLLLNVHDCDRQLLIAQTTRMELEALGLVRLREEYQVLDLTKNIETQKITMPARKGKFVWGVRLWSSLVPHVGVFEEYGHFLVAYGAYLDKRTQRLNSVKRIKQ